MSPTSHLLRRLLLAGAPALAACGGRADLETLSYQAVPNDNIPEQGGAGGSTAGAGGIAGAAGSAAGAGGQAGKAGAAGKGGSGGSAGAPICNNDDPIPRTPDGTLDCGKSPDGSFGFCESRCYVPGPTTIPGPCRAATDPALQKLPNFEPQTCGFSTPSLGPYCDAEAEKFAGNSPACCYLGFSFPCAGRPLLLDGHLSLAPLRRSSWA